MIHRQAKAAEAKAAAEEEKAAQEVSQVFPMNVAPQIIDLASTEYSIAKEEKAAQEESQVFPMNVATPL